MGANLPNALSNNTPHDAVPVMENFTALRDAYNSHAHRNTGTDVNPVNYEDIADKPATFAPSAHRATHAPGGSDALAAADLPAHKANHATGGSDAIGPADIGAAATSALDASSGHNHTGKPGQGPRLLVLSGTKYAAERSGDYQSYVPLVTGAVVRLWGVAYALAGISNAALKVQVRDPGDVLTPVFTDVYTLAIPDPTGPTFNFPDAPLATYTAPGPKLLWFTISESAHSTSGPYGSVVLYMTIE